MPGADRGHRRRLGEHFRIGADADFQILAPGVLIDQHLLQLHRFRRAGLELREIVADQPHHFLADGLRRRRIAARPLLDHALQHRDRKGDARRFQHLQVERREQPGFCAVAAVGRRVGDDAFEIADPFRRRCRAAPPPGFLPRRARSRSENLALTSKTPSLRTATTAGPAMSGIQTRPTSVPLVPSSRQDILCGQRDHWLAPFIVVPSIAGP